MKELNKNSIVKTISMWLVLGVLGIIGTWISMSIIQLSLIPIIIGLGTAILGIIIYESIHNNSLTTIPKKDYLAYSLIFIGFTFAWMIAWIIFLCYFRHSTYMYTIYL